MTEEQFEDIYMVSCDLKHNWIGMVKDLVWEDWEKYLADLLNIPEVRITVG